MISRLRMRRPVMSRRARIYTAAGTSVVVVAALLPTLVFGGDASAATPPSKIVFTTQPSDGAPKTALPTQPKVTLADANGAAVSTSSTVTLTLTGPNGAALNRIAALTCTNSSMAASGGVAQFAGCSVDRGGIYTLTATDATDNLTAHSANFFVSGAAALSFTNQGSGGVAGSAWTDQPEVTVLDAKGAVVTAATSEIALNITAGTGATGATLSCTNNKVTAVSGVAHFAGCKIDKSGSGYTLSATDATDLLQVTGTALTVSAGAPSQLAFSPEPVDSVGGANLVKQPVVLVQDAKGNTAIGNTDTITLAIKSGTGTPGAKLTCPATAAVDGKATFSGCSIDKSGVGYQLVATDSTANLSATSDTFTVTSGGATTLKFSTQPGGGAGGAAFGQQPVVSITDAGGNPVPGSVTLSIVPGTGTSGATLTCSANPNAAAAGVATFSGCSVSATGTGYKLRATSGLLTVDSAAFDVTAGVPSALAFSTQPGDGKGGAALSTQPVVTLADSGGNPAAGSVTLAIAAGTGTPGATISCSSNPVSGGGGSATFSGCAVDKAGTGYRLVATSGGAKRYSEPFDVTVGPVAQLDFTSQPGDGTGGTPLADQPVVTVQDAGGNQITSSTASISLSVTSGSGSGTLTCTSTDLPAVRGAARFDGCAVDRAASAYTLTAVDSTDGLNATSSTFAITAGKASKLVFTGQPGGGEASSPIAAQPAVTLVDRGGNPVSSSDTVSLSVTPGTGSGGSLDCADSSVDADPTASFSGCSVDNAGSGYTLTAKSGNLTAESAPFSVVLAPSVPLGQAPTDVPNAQTFGTRLIGVNPTSAVNDVNTATGELTFGEEDLKVAGLGVPFDLVRTYNSADKAGGSFGPGWTSVLDMGVSVAPDKKTATVRAEDGQRLVFTAGASGTWTAPAGARASLACTGVVCTVTRFDGSTFTVVNGKLMKYVSATGQGLTFSWKAGSVAITVQTTASKPLVVTATLDSTGRVTKVATPTRSVGYTYAGGLLATVRDVRQQTWNYSYAAGLLTRTTDPTGDVRRTATYSANGLVVAATQQGSGTTHTDDTFDYGTGVAHRNALTDVQGVLRRETYTDTYVGNVLVEQTSPVGATLRYSYDKRVNLIEMQLPNGFVQQLTYDAADNLVKSSTPLSSTSASVVTTTYDKAHRMLTQTDANGNTTRQTYAANALSTVNGPDVAKGTSYAYNAAFEVTAVRTAVGQQTYGYDAAGNVTNVVQRDLKGDSLNGRGTSSTYDEAGNRLTSVDPRGNNATVDPAYRSTWTYDAAGHVLTQTLPGPTTTTYTYDAAGDVASVTNAQGTTTYSWDENALTLTTKAPSGTTTKTFDPSGNLITETDAHGNRTTHVYDAAGREVSTTTPDGVTSNFAFDPMGNVVRAMDTQGNTLTRQYDTQGHVIREVSDGVVTRAGFDAAGNTVSSIDKTGALTRATYNSHNQVTSVTTAAGTTRYAYDLASGELLNTTDANGHVTSYTYDAAGRRITMSRAGSVTRYGYDLGGNVNSVVDPDGRKTLTTYNPLNLVTKTVYSQLGTPTLTVSQGYDSFGRRTSMTDASGTHSYSYDKSGNLVSASVAGGTFRYDYSKAGRVTETYPDGSVVTYGVDDTQRVMSVESGTPGDKNYVQASYVRDDQRRTTALAYSNGVLETQQYDADGNVVDQQLRNASGGLADSAFTYDSNGNRLTAQDTVGGTTTADRYGYDALGQLTSFTTASGAGTLTGATVTPPSTSTSTPSAPTSDATIAGGSDTAPAYGVSTSVDAANGATTTFGYDNVGNRTSAASPSGTVATTYDTADRVIRQTGGGTLAGPYDRSGNVLKLGSTTFRYDAAGRVASETTGGKTVSYTYDGDGHRIAKSQGGNVTTQFVWDPASSQLALELNRSGGLIRRYINGDGPVAMQTPSATYFFHLDPIGSVSELTDARGDVVAAYHYDAFGNVTTVGSNAPANPLLFQGQYLDSETGLYSMGARYYDPSNGRFTQTDPVEHKVGSASESPYVFVSNRPTVLTDPTGNTPSVPTVDSIFLGQRDDATNAVNDTKLGAAATGAAVKGGLFVAKQVVPRLSALASGGAKTGAQAVEQASTKLAGVSSAVKALGVGLAIVGVGLSVYLAVDTCLHSDAYSCAGAVVGTTVGAAFAFGCMLITSGVGSFACGIVGTVLSVGLQYVITNFGPEIVAGILQGATIVGQAFQDGAQAVADGVNTAIDAVSSFANDAAGAIVSGFNDATAAISSGFDSAMQTLTQAGYAAQQLADVLANTFQEGFDDAVSGLIGLGYSIKDIADSAIAVFSATAEEFASALKDGFNYTAAQITGALVSAYDTVAQGAAQILSDIGFAVDQVAQVLSSTFNEVAAGAAEILDKVGYAFGQIAGALDTVFAATDKAVADVLNTLSATANQVGAALRDFYGDLDDAAAAALDYAGYAVDEIASALDTAYSDAAQAVATILDDLSYGATEIAGALKGVFDSIDLQVAQILRTLSFTVNEVAGALKTAFSDVAEAAATALRTVGFLVTEVGDALKNTFNEAAAGAAAVLNDIGYAVTEVADVLKSTFNQAASAAVSTLSSIGYQIADVALALKDTFTQGAKDAANALTAAFTNSAIANALQNVFAQSTQQIAQVFKDLGQSASVIAGILKDAFNTAADTVASVLKNIGEAAADIASVLQNTFNKAVGDVANLLSSIGFNNDTINAIGGAFEDFGKKVANCFTSFFSDC